MGKAVKPLRIFCFLIFILLTLTGCASPSEPVLPAQTITPESRPTKTPIFTPSTTLTTIPTYTLTPKASGTPAASPSPTNTLVPSATPTFDASNVITWTPVSPAECPPENPELVPTFAFPQKLCLDVESQVLDFLNAGGQLQRVEKELYNAATQVDLTNDGVTEFTIAGCTFQVYSCMNGQYETILDIGDKEGFSHILAVEDMNLNGVPELIIGGDGGPFTNASTVYYRILEWDGQTIRNLVSHPDFRSRYNGGGIVNGWIYSDGVGREDSNIWENMSLQDTDGNGTKEFILECGLPADWDGKISGGPTRAEIHTYMWNGKEFNLESVKITPPQFRFQAVQDADYATLDGDYSRALELYQQVIFDNDLDWWSIDKAEQWSESAILKIQGVATPTPLPIDTTERSILTAYAYYRIMLLNILNGVQSEAESAYKTLVNEYEAGDPGYAFVELATSFWTEFDLSRDIQQACSRAIKYTEAHQESTIRYLGTGYHGRQSHQYKPRDVCPFIK